MSPIEAPKVITAYMCLKLAADGKFVIDASTTGSDMGYGFYSDLREAQKHQTMEALKLNKVHIFPIDWPL